MARFILVSAFALFAFVSGEGMFVADQASAACCMCGTCRSFCTCPGVGTCPKCDAPDSQITQANNGGNTETVSIREARGPMPSPIIASETTDRLVRLAARKCARSNFRLKLLEQAEYIPMFESVLLKGDQTRDTVVAFQITVDER